MLSKKVRVFHKNRYGNHAIVNLTKYGQLCFRVGGEGGRSGKNVLKGVTRL